MAVVTMKQIKTTLNRSIAYITNPSKTMDGSLVSANYTDDTSDPNVLANRMLAVIDESTNGRRTGGVLAHHVIQSFSPEDSRQMSAERLHALGAEFMDEITGGEYQYVIATHVDREHTHNHIIVCSVSQLSHRKMRVTKGTLGSWRTISDHLCQEHGLSVLPERKHDRRRYGASLAELYVSAKGDAIKDTIRTAIDLAAAGASDFPSFAMALSDHGVRVSVRGRHLTFLDMASGMKVRDVKLGRAYDELNIMARIGRSTVTPISFNRSMIAERHDGTIRVWLPRTRRRQSITLPMTCIVNDGATYRAYLPSLNPIVVTDEQGRYSRRLNTAGLYEYFARPPIHAATERSEPLPITIGKTDAQRRWYATQARKLSQLDDLAEQLNTADRLHSRGIAIDDAIAATERRLMAEHDAFQATLIAIDEAASADRAPDSDMASELREREAKMASISHELDVLRKIKTLTRQPEVGRHQRHTR